MSYHLLKCLGILLLAINFISCEASRPSGKTETCTSTTSIQEESLVEADTHTLLGTGQFGQFIDPTESVVAKSLMIKALPSNSTTSLRIRIYRVGINELSSELPTEELKTIDIFEPLVADANGEIWFDLPEAFEFTPGNASEGTFDKPYLLMFQAFGGSLELSLGARTSATRFRLGTTSFDGISLSSTDTTKSLAFGISGDTDCNF